MIALLRMKILKSNEISALRYYLRCLFLSGFLMRILEKTVYFLFEKGGGASAGSAGSREGCPYMCLFLLDKCFQLTYLF
jgi:hypothetical protein